MTYVVIAVQRHIDISDDARYQQAEAARDAAADFADESACWTDAEWLAYEAERQAEYDAAMGPVVDTATAAEWERERMVDERAAWDQAMPLAEFDSVPF